MDNLASSTGSAGLARPPWERQPGESEAAYNLFALYRDQAPPRTYSAVAMAASKASSTVAGHARRHCWSRRVGAYDNFKAQQQQQTTSHSWRKVTAEHAEIVGAVRSRLRERLLGEGVPALAADDLEWNDVARLLRDVISLERVVHGHPGDLALRATLLDSSVAIDHIRCLLDIARDRMDDQAYAGFVLDYRAAVGLGPPGPGARSNGTGSSAETAGDWN